MQKARSIFLLILAPILVMSCQTLAREANVNQDKWIGDYIENNFSENEIFRNGGVTRIVLSEGPQGAPVVEKGDSVYIFYAGYIFVQNGPTTQFVLDSAMVRVGHGDLIKGLELGLPGARQGEEAMIIFSADDGYGTTQLGLVPENTALLFDVGVASVKKEK